MTVEDAIGHQHRFVDALLRHTDGSRMMSVGDLGYGFSGHDRPAQTVALERALADLFAGEDAVLVWGAGTGAIRAMLTAALPVDSTLLVHRAPTYKSTVATLEGMAVRRERCDMNDTQSLSAALEASPDAVLIQHSPQSLTDTYSIEEVVRQCAAADGLTLVDDNYSAFRAHRIGVELGADASAFSLFKVGGPPGIGCVVGTADLIAGVRKLANSGGSTIQGHIATEATTALTTASVRLAVQGEVVDDVCAWVHANAARVPLIESAEPADVNERSVLIRLREPVARDVVKAAVELGAAPYPVGGESRYEIAPLFYRLASTFVADDPTLIDTSFRVNPNRASAPHVVDLLERSLGATHISDHQEER